MRTKPVKIFVTDDDHDDQHLIKEAFSLPLMAAEIIPLYNGEQLLQSLSECREVENKPDIIILDLNMPVMDGLTALTKLKRLSHCSDIPVYILSTSKHESDKKTCELMGAKQFFTKPTSFSQLKAVARQILSQEFPDYLRMIN